MRTIKELLQLMLDNQRLFDFGLCTWANQLFGNEIISGGECYRLREYIEANRPSKYSSFDAFDHRDRAFYWKASNIKPRIKWLKKHIAKN